MNTSSVPHASSNFRRVFDEATVLFAALVNSITSQPEYWLQNLTALQQAYSHLTTINDKLNGRISALKGVDEELVKARASVVATQEALNHSFTEQLRLMQQAPVTTSHLTSRPSPNHPDPDKFNGNKAKLESFVTQLRIKLQQNADHFIRPEQNTEQNQLSYAISWLEGDAFTQVELFVSCQGIDLRDVAALEDLLEARFGEVDPVGTAKHELYRLYQANKDLEVFLNTFLVLAKKAKLDDDQTLDLLYEKLSNEFKNLLVTMEKQTNLTDLIRKLQNMDANIKIISQRKRPAPNTNGKPFTSSKLAYQQTPRSTPTTVTTTTSAPSTASGTHAGPMDVLLVGKRGPLSEEEKERRNKLGLCRYCGQPGHIARDHSDLATLLAKRRTAGINEMTISSTLLSLISLSSTSASLLENASSPSTVALGDH